MAATKHDAIDILAQACCDVERKDLDAVQSLLDAIFYLRAGHYPSIGTRGIASRTGGK
jgi:hypothetical protein